MTGSFGYFALLSLVFLAVTAAVGAMALLFTREQAISGRLSRLLATPGAIFKGRQKLVQEEKSGLLARISKPLHKLSLPSEDAIKKKVRLKLIQAGFRTNAAYRNFLAAKTAATVLLPVAWLTRNVFINFDQKSLLIAVVLAAVGYFLPDVILSHYRQKRQERIFKAVPDALDMMVVCVEAGLGLDMTFKRVGEEIRSLSVDLSDEFLLTNLEVRAGKQRDEALRNMAQRTGVGEVQNLATVLIQTSRFGTSVAKALRVHADSMRIKRRQAAEEIAAKAAVKLLFPLLLFIFPTIFVVLLGPAAIQIARNLLPTLGGN
ncbi:MAG: type II secretion system F family protein [Desulfuromonadales bacterium]|nr:type II secretion system F family protein [Desulfuromonadales bacterium]